MTRQISGLDSLVYSEGVLEEEENLLQDSTELMQSGFGFKKPKVDPPTIKIMKNVKQTCQEMDLKNSSLAKYLMSESEVQKVSGNTKSFRKLQKDKQKFLALDPKIQNISLKPISKSEKVDELLNYIETQRVQQYVKLLVQYEVELKQLADEVINQKKHLQRQLDNLIEMNKIMKGKLKEIQKYVEETRHKVCRCQGLRDFSFSKSKESPINYLDRFDFAKTIISSIQELELKKVQEEEGLSISEMNFVELIWYLKNKVEDKNLKISHGLIDRLATGPTLKQWIVKIDESLSIGPKITSFKQPSSQNTEDSVLKNFVQLVKSEEQSFIKNIQQSSNRQRELQIIKHSSLMTFLHILQDQYKLYDKNQVIAYFGEINRCLILIEKKSGSVCLSEVVSTQDILSQIETLYN